MTDTIPPEVLAAGAGLTPAVLPSLSDDELLGHLESVAGAISQVSDRQQSLWDLRLAIYQEARRRQPPITQQRIASAAGVSEVAVIQAIKKSAKKAEAGALMDGWEAWDDERLHATLCDFGLSYRVAAWLVEDRLGDGTGASHRIRTLLIKGG